jgi:hypothetical protein
MEFKFLKILSKLKVINNANFFDFLTIYKFLESTFIMEDNTNDQEAVEMV